MIEDIVGQSKKDHLAEREKETETKIEIQTEKRREKSLIET